MKPTKHQPLETRYSDLFLSDFRDIHALDRFCQTAFAFCLDDTSPTFRVILSKACPLAYKAMVEYWLGVWNSHIDTLRGAFCDRDAPRRYIELCREGADIVSSPKEKEEPRTPEQMMAEAMLPSDESGYMTDLFNQLLKEAPNHTLDPRAVARLCGAVRRQREQSGEPTMFGTPPWAQEAFDTAAQVAVDLRAEERKIIAATSKPLFDNDTDTVPRGSAAVRAIDQAWGVIANVGGGNWGHQSNAWCEAARRWRDKWMGQPVDQYPELPEEPTVTQLADAAIAELEAERTAKAVDHSKEPNPPKGEKLPELNKNDVLTSPKREIHSFGDVLPYLAAGYPVARGDWYKDCFIFQQVPSVVPGAIIPKMTSFPPIVKRILGEEFPLHYFDQIAQVNFGGGMDGASTIQGYTPSVEDLLALDWYVFAQ